MDSFDTFILKAKLDKKLHQREGVKWMLKRETTEHMVNGGLVADEMGLGKTIQVLGTILSNYKVTTLIVLPLSILLQWRDQIELFVGHTPLIYHGGSKKHIDLKTLSSSPIVLTTYGHVSINKYNRENILHTIKWGRIVFDEGHHLRNTKTNIFRGASMLQSSIKWIITGTPIQNKKHDFYALCSIIGYTSSYYTDPTNLPAIAKWSLLKRTKKSVGIVIPDCVQETITVGWNTSSESYLSEDMHRQLGFSSISTKRVSPHQRVHHLVALMRSKQTVVLPSLIKKKSFDDIIDTSYIKDAIICSSKIDRVCSTIISRKDNNRPKIVFCHFRGEIDVIKKRLEKVYLQVNVLDGRTTAKQKICILANTSVDVLILQVMTGSEGLNLQRYKEIYFTSPHWNPALEDQAIGRCHRIGQTEEVTVFRYTMEGFCNKSISLDTHVNNVQQKKRNEYNIVKGLVPSIEDIIYDDNVIKCKQLYDRTFHKYPKLAWYLPPKIYEFLGPNSIKINKLNLYPSKLSAVGIQKKIEYDSVTPPFME
jgi:SNF2 family DNA or RNA helicase